MKWVVFVLLMIACILLVICYSLCVIASQADEDAERMYAQFESCDTCVHRHESWASEACDGCCVAHSNYERESNSDFKEWEKPPKVEPEEVVTTCVTVPMAVLEKKESEDER